MRKLLFLLIVILLISPALALPNNYNLVSLIGNVGVKFLDNVDFSSFNITNMNYICLGGECRNSWAASNGSGAGSVTSISQGTGIILTPSPITTSGSVALNTTYLDGRYLQSGNFYNTTQVDNNITNANTSVAYYANTTVNSSMKSYVDGTFDAVANAANYLYQNGSRNVTGSLGFNANPIYNASNISFNVSSPSGVINTQANSTAVFNGYLQTPWMSIGEGANYISQSNSFSNAIWTKSAGMTVGSSSAPDPVAGTSGAFLNSTSNGAFIYQNFTDSTNFGWTCSTWIRDPRNVGAIATLRIDTNDTNGTQYNITLNPFWQRYSVTNSSINVHSMVNFTILPNGNNISVYGAMCDPQNFSRPYILTTSSPATTPVTTKSIQMFATLNFPSNGITMFNTFTTSRNTIYGSPINASTDGLILQDTTATNSLVQVMMSPRLRFSGRVWNTTGSIQNDLNLEVLPVNGTTNPYPKLMFNYNVNNNSASSTETNILNISAGNYSIEAHNASFDGNVTFNGNSTFVNYTSVPEPLATNNPVTKNYSDASNVSVAYYANTSLNTTANLYNLNNFGNIYSQNTSYLFNVNRTPNSTRPVFVTATVSISDPALSTSDGQVAVDLFKPDGTIVQNVSSVRTQNGASAVSVTILQQNSLTFYLPANWSYRVRNYSVAGTPTFTFNQINEVTM